MSEETITFNVVYNVQNINESIRSTQRMLLFTNALRLSIVDIQQVMAGPTISNVMWTAIQLTRVWTHLYRLIKATNKAQQTGMVQGLLGGGARGATVGSAARQFAGGQGILSFGTGGALGVGSVSQIGLWASLTAFAATPVGAVTIAGAAFALTVAGAVGIDMRNTRIQNEWRKRQREIARSQGIEF